MTKNSWLPMQTESSIYLVYHWSKPASISQFGFILREKHKGYHDALLYSTFAMEKKNTLKLKKKKKITCTTEIKISEIHTYLLSSFNP